MALLLTIGAAVLEWWHFGLEVLNSCKAGTNLLYWCQGRGHIPWGIGGLLVIRPTARGALSSFGGCVEELNAAGLWFVVAWWD